jgi:hypothetical protein
MAYGDKLEETPEDKEKVRLLLALYQVDGITQLTKNNEYKQFIYMHLNSIKYELERQLTNLNHSVKITKEAQKEQ